MSEPLKPRDDAPERNPHETTRRDFLVKSAAVAGAATVLAATDKVAAMVKDPIPKSAARASLADGEAVRIGIIGTGGMGTGHVMQFLRFAKLEEANVDIVALSDVCKSRMGAAKQKVEGLGQEEPVQLHQYYPDMLARKDIHGVLIASPEHWHAKQAEDAIAAGKDVYVEKPMTLNLADALRLKAVAEANPDILVQVGTQKIMEPKYSEARRIINEGGIGHPTFSQTSYCRNSKDGEWLYHMKPEWVPGDNLDWDAWCGPLGKQEWDPQIYARWRRYRKFSTGIVGDLLVHQMTPLLLALDVGWPTRVVASGGHYVDKAMENHDQVNLNIEFEKGHTMIVAGSTCNEVGLETIIRGHMGNIYLNSRHCVVRPERVFVDDIDEQTVECQSIGNDQNQLRKNWLECIRTRKKPLSDVELGTKIMVIVDLATRSMWEGCAFTFDPKRMEIARS